LGATERAIVVGLYWRALSPNRVCVCRRITGRPELSTSATYVTTQARRRAAAVQDPDSARIRGLCAASNPAVYALPRAPFRLSLLIRSE